MFHHYGELTQTSNDEKAAKHPLIFLEQLTKFTTLLDLKLATETINSNRLIKQVRSEDILSKPVVLPPAGP